jgi:leucyl aminopeptidase
MIPTSTNVSIDVSKSAPAADAIAVFVTEKTKSLADEASVLSEPERHAINRLLAAGLSRGKAKEVAAAVAELPAGKRRCILVAGLGAPEKISPNTIREAAGALAKAVRKNHLKSLAIFTPAATGLDLKSDLDDSSVAQAIISGFLLASFRYAEYKGAGSKQKPDDEDPKHTQLTLVAPVRQLQISKEAADRARIIADAQNFARTIASRPGNNISPPTLAKVAMELAKDTGLTCRVLDEKQMAKLGMGGILAVGGASARPPRMIALEYKPTKSAKTKPLLVIGKAITFDSGGISIKPADKMQRMIFDKCGAMAVLGLMYAVAKLKLPIHVVGVLTSAENTLGGEAYRPGDILRMFNGVTVEVTNTDAEGRLVLADALAWGIATYKPAAVVDLATLTGGVVVALGDTMAGVMTNNDALLKQIQSAANVAAEKIWQLPIGDDQREQIKSEPADILNAAGREASPLQGGAFLSYFVPQDGSAPWVHIDIAGVAWTEKELPYYVKGATGWGVRTLVEWVSARIGQ